MKIQGVVLEIGPAVSRQVGHIVRDEEGNEVAFRDYSDAALAVETGGSHLFTAHGWATRKHEANRPLVYRR